MDMGLRKKDQMVILEPKSMFEGQMTLEEIIEEMQSTMFGLNDSQMFSPIENFFQDILPEALPQTRFMNAVISNVFDSSVLK